MEEDRYEFACGGSDLQGATIKLDGVVVVDLARSAQGEMQIEYRTGRTGMHGVEAAALSFREDAARDQAGGGVARVVLSVDFHLEDFICMEV